jgi:pimeloyl-ACP methyl ester carboxylesterase
MALVSSPAPAARAQSDDLMGRLERIDVGGYSLYLQCTGTGSPTVVFSSDVIEDWGPVPAQSAGFTRSCAYDRAGFGMSGRGRTPATVGSMATELRSLLSRAKLQPPYVLVGEGLEGSALWLSVSRDPTAIAGLILVDAVPPSDFVPADRALFGQPSIDLKASRAQMAAAHSVGSIPLVVISHGVHLSFPRRIEATWATQQRKLASLSSDSVWVVAKHSAYQIPRHQPDIVSEAVREVLLVSRSPSHRLTPCRLWATTSSTTCPNETGR